MKPSRFDTCPILILILIHLAIFDQQKFELHFSSQEQWHDLVNMALHERIAIATAPEEALNNQNKSTVKKLSAPPFLAGNLFKPQWSTSWKKTSRLSVSNKAEQKDQEKHVSFMEIYTIDDHDKHNK